MKIIAIGDTHGRDLFKTILNQEPDADKVVFIGDYFDSFDVSPEKQASNFADIVAYKRNNKDKVVLLIGNHDFHYLEGIYKTYSGYQIIQRPLFENMLKSALKEGLLQMCYTYEDFLFTHAGVTKTWCENNEIDLNNIEQSINDLFTYKPLRFSFTPGERMDSYGNEVCQTPIWVRIPALSKDRIDGYTQVIGHTQQEKAHIGLYLLCVDTLDIGVYFVIDTDKNEIYIRDIINN